MTGVKNPMPGVVYMPEVDLDHYVREGVLTDETFIAALSRSFAENADRVAISEPGIEVTYRELDEVSDRGAAALHRLGLRPGDRALFQVRNCKEVLYAFIACLKLGVIPICTLAAHRQAEIGYLGNHGTAKAHFIHSDDPKFDLADFANQMRGSIPSLEHVITVRGPADKAGILSFDALIAGEDAAAAKSLVNGIEHDPFQVVIFQLSGGTSGIPKIIPRFSNEYRYTVQTVIDWFGFDRDIVSFTPNPLMHNAPMACYWAPALMLGGEVAIAIEPTLAEIEGVLAERRPTWIAIAKVQLVRLKEIGAFDRLNFDNVFGFVILDSAEIMRAMIGAPCVPIFGMTEGLLAFARPSDPEEAQLNTLGRPTSPYDELRIVEPNTETDVADGQTGELLVRGPCTIRGYFDAGDRNLEAFTSDGFYRSGDLMRFLTIEGERYLVFEGRVKDVVDRGGEKINCSEVENALILHPAVGAVACVAMPDPLYGERMCAFIVPREGAEPLSLAEAGQYLQDHGLAKFKWPERIEIVNDLPMTSSNKVSKPIMREIIAKKLKEAAEADRKGAIPA
jgi:non-ribosomal peptide synthetase component E (peptide arylation enzyme)